ncbi:MAG TPA: hypothetical protein G4O11_07955 [Anaerolineae bacterium]|nr:hypothetical protein [Anaerolineae bacterium]
MKPDQSITGEFNIEYEILAYLDEHPESSDTEIGISGWWILEQCIKLHSPKVKKALKKLKRKRLVLEEKGRYRINERKRGEIQALLKQRAE